MMIFDKNYCNIYTGDTVTYKDNKYKVEVSDNGLKLNDDLLIECNNLDVLNDVECYGDVFDYQDVLEM